MQGGQEHQLEADMVWSTIPVSALASALRPMPPQPISAAARSLEYRAMILIYAVLGQERFSEFDAHYFPEQSIPITRLSEPKNYSNSQALPERTVLCAELPCSTGDAVWNMTDRELGQVLCASLDTAGIPIRAPIQQLVTRRLSNAYPIYRLGYDTSFRALDEYVDGVNGLLTFGRQGLFVHDNTHHALFMAYAAAACLSPDGQFDRTRWHTFRQRFDTHVVED
jgi:protoporphyrinogen oxidase